MVLNVQCWLLNEQDNWDPDWQSTSSSKVAYLVKRLKALQGTNEEMGLYTDNSNDDMHTENSFPLHTRDAKSSFQEGSISSTKTNLVPEKVLIFSQFLEHIHVIEQQVLFLHHILDVIICESFLFYLLAICVSFCKWSNLLNWISILPVGC